MQSRTTESQIKPVFFIDGEVVREIREGRLDASPLLNLSF